MADRTKGKVGIKKAGGTSIEFEFEAEEAGGLITGGGHKSLPPPADSVVLQALAGQPERAKGLHGTTGTRRIVS